MFLKHCRTNQSGKMVKFKKQKLFLQLIWSFNWSFLFFHLSIRSVLGNWIEKINNFSDDDIKTIVPAGRWDHLNLERFRKRGKEAAELIGQSNNVNLGNLVTRNVQLLSDQQNVQVS